MTSWNRLVSVALDASYLLEFFGIRETTSNESNLFFDRALSCLETGHELAERQFRPADRPYSKKTLLYNQACIAAVSSRVIVHRALALSMPDALSPTREIIVFEPRRFFRSLRQCWTKNPQRLIRRIGTEAFDAATAQVERSETLLSKLGEIGDDDFDTQFWQSFAWSDPDFLLLRWAPGISDGFHKWCHRPTTTEHAVRLTERMLIELKLATGHPRSSPEVKGPSQAARLRTRR